MKNLLLLLFILPATIQAQDTVKAASGGKPMAVITENPRFNGDLNAYISQHLLYPETAAQGTVYIIFTVEKDGSLSHIKISQSVAPALDSAAIQCVRGMPKWIPSTLNGKPISNSMNLPIRFAMPVIEQNSVNPTTPPRVK